MIPPYNMHTVTFSSDPIPPEELNRLTKLANEMMARDKQEQKEAEEKIENNKGGLQAHKKAKAQKNKEENPLSQKFLIHD